jgi:hypothetical protein
VDFSPRERVKSRRLEILLPSLQRAVAIGMDGMTQKSGKKILVYKWEPPPETRGRKPIGPRAMTRAELMARYRAKKKAALPKKVEKKRKARTDFGSLTDHLSSTDSPVRKFIDTQFPHLEEMSKQINLSLNQFQKVTLKVYPKNVLYMLAGTAMDYRVRAYFSNAPHTSSAIKNGLRFLSAIGFFQSNSEPTVRNPWFKSTKRSIVRSIGEELIFSFESFVRKLRPKRRLLGVSNEEQLCRYCILFALIDFFRRHTPGAFEKLMEIGNVDTNRMLRAVDKRVVSDLMALSASFYRKNKKLLQSFSKVHLGQPLAGSKDVGGADFDIVVDGCLFENKTTVKPKITTGFLRQIIGYFLLDYTDEFKMRRAVIYLTRQDHAEFFDIKKDLLRTKKPIAAIRESFSQLKIQP